MLLLLLIVVWWMACAAAAMAEGTGPRPLLFIVLRNGSSSEGATHVTHASRGTSLRLEPGKYVAPRIPVRHPILHFTDFQHIAIDTDNEPEMRDSIDRWMVRECARARAATAAREQRLAGGASSLPPPPPLQCYVWPSSCCAYTLPRIDTMTADAKHAEKLALAIPKAPVTSPDACASQASAADCVAPLCRYFGPAHRCKPADFCGFASQLQCEQTGHCRYAFIKRSRRAKNFEWRCVSK